MSFRLVPNSVTLDDLERRYSPNPERSVAEFMHVSIVFLVHVQCRRKESSRSLSHLLMSFLFVLGLNFFHRFSGLNFNPIHRYVRICVAYAFQNRWLTGIHKLVGLSYVN